MKTALIAATVTACLFIAGCANKTQTAPAAEPTPVEATAHHADVKGELTQAK